MLSHLILFRAAAAPVLQSDLKTATVTRCTASDPVSLPARLKLVVDNTRGEPEKALEHRNGSKRR